MVFSTYHQVKGLERPIVMVFYFDQSYLTFYETNRSPLEMGLLPNPLYVALTRATDQLILIHHNNQDYLDCLIKKNLSSVCHVEIIDHFHPRSSQNHHLTRTNYSVTDLLRHMPAMTLDQCLRLLIITERPINDPSPLDLPLRTQQGDLCEAVSEITGVAIPSYYEYRRTHKMTIYQHSEGSILRPITDFLSLPKGRCLLR